MEVAGEKGFISFESPTGVADSPVRERESYAPELDFTFARPPEGNGRSGAVGEGEREGAVITFGFDHPNTPTEHSSERLSRALASRAPTNER